MLPDDDTSLEQPTVRERCGGSDSVLDLFNHWRKHALKFLEYARPSYCPGARPSSGAATTATATAQAAQGPELVLPAVYEVNKSHIIKYSRADVASSMIFPTISGFHNSDGVVVLRLRALF